MIGLAHCRKDKTKTSNRPNSVRLSRLRCVTGQDGERWGEKRETSQKETFERIAPVVTRQD